MHSMHLDFEIVVILLLVNLNFIWTKNWTATVYCGLHLIVLRDLWGVNNKPLAIVFGFFSLKVNVNKRFLFFFGITLGLEFNLENFFSKFSSQEYQFVEI
jgi:hypothetical protein